MFLGPFKFGDSPYENVWNLATCPVLQEYANFVDLKRCQKYCWMKKGCTAIIFNDKQKGNYGCVLQKCKLPVPEATAKNRNYVGYSITLGIDSNRK